MNIEIRGVVSVDETEDGQYIALRFEPNEDKTHNAIYVSSGCSVYIDDINGGVVRVES